MKNIRNIRKSVFETNSSSTHCIVIDDSDIDLIDNSYQNAIDTQINKIVFNLDEQFGWEAREISDLPSKLSYIVLCLLSKIPCLRNHHSDNDKQEQLPLRQKAIEEISTIYQKINDLVLNTTGYGIYCAAYNNIIKNIKIENINNIYDEDDEFNGYVDHDSNKYDKMIAPLLDNTQDLKSFLFNPKSALYTHNDNLDEDEESFLPHGKYTGGN
jgi:hypothetical protein